jgi:hypothetical protein
VAQELWSYKDDIGGRTLSVRCSFRIETKPFLNGTTMVRLPATSAPSPAPPVNATPSAATPGRGESKCVLLSGGITDIIAQLVNYTFIISKKTRQKLFPRKSYILSHLIFF